MEQEIFPRFLLFDFYFCLLFPATRDSIKIEAKKEAAFHGDRCDKL